MGVGPTPEVSGEGGAATVGYKELRSMGAAGCNGVAAGEIDASGGT